LLLSPATQAATLYVANNALDGAGCGTQANPCRSISRAIANAAPGDTIIVGPGKYGDLDGDGVIGEPGEETGSPGCGCMLSVNKSVNLVSSNGAAATVIDATTVQSNTNVLLILNGGEFGRPGKGFTVTDPQPALGAGIAIDSANVKVRGNQVVSMLPGHATGIYALGGGPIRIEGNQVVGYWDFGIWTEGTGKTVRKNQVSVRGGGGTVNIWAGGDSAITGNIVTGVAGIFTDGIWAQEGSKVTGNAAYGTHTGVRIMWPFSGVITQNNLVGASCGLVNLGQPGVDATRNYWGAASGPGPAPASSVCNNSGGTTTVTPFATAPFTVKAPVKP
jgi:hypothetical protein